MLQREILFNTNNFLKVTWSLRQDGGWLCNFQEIILPRRISILIPQTNWKQHSIFKIAITLHNEIIVLLAEHASQSCDFPQLLSTDLSITCFSSSL